MLTKKIDIRAFFSGNFILTNFLTVGSVTTYVLKLPSVRAFYAMPTHKSKLNPLTSMPILSRMEFSSPQVKFSSIAAGNILNIFTIIELKIRFVLRYLFEQL